MKSRKGFTLIKLMVVVLIVGILAAITVPIMRGRINAAKWSEGKSGMDTIAKALRAYADKTSSATTSLTDLGFIASDLYGTYFSIGDYSIAAANFTAGDDPELTYTIQCDKVTLSPTRWILTETGTWTPSNP